MKKFNIRRTLELMRYDLTINRKRYLTSFVLYMTFAAGFMLWAMHFAMHANMEGQVDIDSRSELFVIMTGTTLFWMSLAFLLGLLTQVHDYVLCDKQSRQAFFMLPVTNAERFVSRQLTAVLFLLAMPVLIALARLVSLAFLPLLGSVNAEAVNGFMLWDILTNMKQHFLPENLHFENSGYYADFLFLWGAFTLGAILFQKRSFAKILFCVIAYVFIGAKILIHAGPWIRSVMSASTSTVFSTALWWAHGLLWLVGGLWLGYRLLARTQLTRPGLLKR